MEINDENNNIEENKINGNTIEENININLTNFTNDFKNLFTSLFNKISVEDKKFLESKEIENFKEKYSKANFHEFLNEKNNKAEVGKILIDNFLIFEKGDNLESYLILLIDIIPIIFLLYSQRDFYYTNFDNKNQDGNNNDEIKSILNENLIMEKYYLFLGNKIALKYSNGENNIDNSSNYYNLLIKPEFPKVEDFLNSIDIKNNEIIEENYNTILDLIFLMIIRESDIKYLSIYIGNLNQYLSGVNPIISFKIIIFLSLVYVNKNLPSNWRNFNIFLGYTIEFFLSEANSLSRRINELLYEDKFTDFEYNMNTKTKKINFEELFFLRENFFPLLNFIFKVFITNKSEVINLNNSNKNSIINLSNKDDQNIYKLYLNLFSQKDFLLDPKNLRFVHIANFDNNEILKRIYKRLEKYVDDNDKEEINDILNNKENPFEATNKKDYTENNNNNEKEKILDTKINHSYHLISFICDIIEFIYSKFHIMPEIFGENFEIKVDLDPFIAYEDKYKPLFFYDFLQIAKIYFNNCITNISNFINFTVFHNEFKNKHSDKIKDLTGNSEDIYNLFNPFNFLGFNIMFWICWKTATKFSKEKIQISPKESENSNEKFFQKIFYFNKNKQFINLSYSKIKIFDSILPIAAYLLKCSQNFKYMAFELIFDCLDILEDKSIEDLHLLRNYSYDDIYKDLLEFVGGPDPAKKRQIIAKEFNRLLYPLSDQVKKKLILFLLNENLKPNKFINDQMNSFILHNLRLLLKENLNEVERVNNLSDKEILLKNNALFEEKFLKEIITLSVTTKVFVIDIFEVICQGENLIQFLILMDKKNFKGGLNIYNKNYLEILEKENSRILYFVHKWNNSNDEEKMKQVTIDTSEIKTCTDASEKRKELMSDFDRRKSQGLITEGLISHINDFIFKCKKDLSKDNEN